MGSGSLAFAKILATEAGEMLLQYRKQVLERVYTSRTHFRTVADEEIDGMAISVIRKYFPDHDIHSEESGTNRNGSPWRWVVDAVDGTINLWSGFTDHVAFCIALAYEGTPVPGVVNAAIRKEFYLAAQGMGAFCNGEPVHVSNLEDINQVLMVTDSGKHGRTANIPYLEKAHGPGGITCAMATGCASVPLALVAKGALHAYLATSLEPEDMAASVAIIREAGGLVTNLKDEPWSLEDPSILAANPALHSKLVSFFEISKEGRHSER